MIRSSDSPDAPQRTSPRMLSAMVMSRVDRVWQSPTVMSWGGLLTRSASVVVVLPLILKRLSVAEIAVWYLFATMIGLQALADLGFTASFVRAIAYASARRGGDPAQAPVQPLEMQRICATMRSVYLRVALIGGIALAIGGTASLVRPLSHLQNARPAWIAWAVIVGVTTLNMGASTYSSFLQGTEHIAIWRRWEMLTATASIATSAVVLIAGGRLLSLVIANQFWVVIDILRNRYLARSVNAREFRGFTGTGVDPHVLRLVWPSAWRSGIGVLMSYGVVQISGIAYAQLAPASYTATYLISLRILNVLNQFAQAPFASKLPSLARLYAAGKREELLALTAAGMRRTYWSFVLSFLAVGVIIRPALRFIHSRAQFADPVLWGLMGTGVLIERYGAMHIQLYSTTNRIIWHIANGVTGAVYIALCFGMWRRLHVYAFPVAYILANLSFYTWYSARHAHSEFGLSFKRFDLALVAFPSVMMASYLFLALLYQPSIQ